MLLLPGSTNPTRPLARTLRALAMAFACAQGVVAALPDAAQAASDGVRERALRLAREGRCTSALPELDAARAASPEAAQDAELALRSGQCRMRLHR
jgi:hypothetical protein